jgi:hypothetical protein
MLGNRVGVPPQLFSDFGVKPMEHFEDPLSSASMRSHAQHQKMAREHEKLRESPEYQAPLASLRQAVAGLFETLHLCERAATRWSTYGESYLFPRHKDDIGEAALAAQLAIENGALNPARRELRYMLEVAVNTAYVDEAARGLDLDGRISFLRSGRVNARNVDHVRDLPLRMLGGQRDAFIKATREAWVCASNYVHLSKRRIDEKVRLRAEGVGVGFETPQMLAAVANEVHGVCSIVVVLAFETIGPGFTGDILVTGGLDSREAWPFHKSSFIGAVDACFDDKRERQADLASHVARRERRIGRPSQPEG